MTKIRIALILSVAAILSSCSAAKHISYLQDMVPDVTYNMPLQPEAIIAKGDRLKISVYCSTPALAAPFNLSKGSSAVDPVSSTVSGQSTAADNSYEVDNAGLIDFPVFGEIAVEGKTLGYLKEYLENELISRKYIKDPEVTVEFANFTYTLIGEISSGVHYVPDGKINIFDALAEAGEPTEYALLNEVCVIRTVDGNRRMYTIDLTSKDCYFSPVFFLQQNDMVYVKPRQGKQDVVVKDHASFITSLASIIVSCLNLFLWYQIYTR